MLVITGKSVAKAVIVSNVKQEYQWLDQRYPDYRRQKQFVTEKDGKSYDVHRIVSEQGESLDLYFDISTFF